MKKIFISILILVSFTFPIMAQSDAESPEKYLADAQQGKSGAQNMLGIAYAEGLGTKADNAEGVKWFRKSAEQGNVFGACNLGLHYGRGSGIKKDKVMAMKWSYISNSLDSLKCHPDDFVAYFKPTKSQISTGWKLAIEWLKAHPDLDNNFRQKPWMDQGEWPVTLRQRSVPSKNFAKPNKKK